MAFIVFEGNEGVGKTTHIKKTQEWLKTFGIKSIISREPGGTLIAEELRALFKKIPENGDEPLAITELLMVMAARAEHVKKVIEPALENDLWILCDRFLDSSYIYQGIRGKIDKKYIDLIAKPIINDIIPDLTFVLHTSNQVYRNRIQDRIGNFSSDRLDFSINAEEIFQGFKSLVENKTPYPSGIVPDRVLITSDGLITETFEQIQMSIVNKILKFDNSYALLNKK